MFVSVSVGPWDMLNDFMSKSVSSEVSICNDVTCRISHVTCLIEIRQGPLTPNAEGLGHQNHVCRIQIYINCCRSHHQCFTKINK